VPSLVCAVGPTNNSQLGNGVQLGGTAGSSLTTTAPSTIGTITATANVPYVVCL
jgi:hypothetical protein